MILSEMNSKTIKIIIALTMILISVGLFAFLKKDNNPGIDNYAGQNIMLQCVKCGVTVTMDKSKYLSILHNKYGDLEGAYPCSKCGSSMAVLIECPKCKNNFKKGSVPNDFSDRCPKCHYSAIEQARQSNGEQKK
jgi:hypothetical protein